MNILLILGNGFDLNLNLKTSYKNFYDHLNLKNLKDEDLIKFKNAIHEDIDNWSDLELALGKHTTFFKNENDFNLLLEKVKDALADYIIEQEANFNVDFINLNKFKDDLIYPEKYLPKLDKDSINLFKKQWRGQQCNLTIFTFNYTKVLDKLLNNEKINSIFGSHKNGSKIIFKGIHHIHGTADDGMVLGVNDSSQVLNDEIIQGINLRESFIKSDCNSAQKHGIPDLFKTIINSSNLIIVFGSSIGDTDKVWWDIIGKQLLRNCILIYFTKGDEISLRHKYKIGEVERKSKKHFISKTELSENNISDVNSKIFIGHNTSMLDLIEKNN